MAGIPRLFVAIIAGILGITLASARALPIRDDDDTQITVTAPSAAIQNLQSQQEKSFQAVGYTNQWNQIIWTCVWIILVCAACFLGAMVLWKFKLVCHNWQVRLVRRHTSHRHHRLRHRLGGESYGEETANIGGAQVLYTIDDSSDGTARRPDKSVRKTLTKAQLEAYPVRQHQVAVGGGNTEKERISVNGTVIADKTKGSGGGDSSGDSSGRESNSGSSDSGQDQAEENEIVATECMICLEAIEGSDWVRDLPCKHLFHQTCLDQWLTRRSCYCPLCKYQLYPTTTTTDLQDRLPPQQPMTVSAGGQDDNGGGDTRMHFRVRTVIATVRGPLLT